MRPYTTEQRRMSQRVSVALVVIVIAVLVSVPPSGHAQAVIGPCIQFTDKDGNPTSNFRCDFSANDLEVRYVGGSVQFTMNGTDVGGPEAAPPKANRFTATFAGGSLTAFTWMHGNKSLGNANVPAGANDFHFTSQHGIDSVIFTTDGKVSSTTRPPLTTIDLELFLVPQPAKPGS